MSLKCWYELARVMFARIHYENRLRDIDIASPPRYGFVRGESPMGWESGLR